MSFQYFPSENQVKSVSLLVHGLNVKPEVMLPIQQLLNQAGSSVYLVKLTGHHGSTEDMREASLEKWVSELHSAYLEASDTAKKESVPLQYAGYSMGAALGSYLMHKQAHVQFDKQILFAPAHFLRRRTHLIRTLFFLNDKQLIRSLTPPPHRATPATSIGAYRAIFRMEKELRQSNWKSLALPSLVFMDEGDELISFTKLQKALRGDHLSKHYSVINLDTRTSNTYRHLIIDPTSTGQENWEYIRKEIHQFLNR